MYHPSASNFTESRRATRLARLCGLGLAGLLIASALPGQAVTDGRRNPSIPVPLELVQSCPVETEKVLLDEDIPLAHEVWREMIEAATDHIELAHFYASNQADSRLEAVVSALEAAADRGVRIRFLAEKKFYRTYPQTLDRLASREGIVLRLYDVASLMGGVLHAKMMLVDGRDGYFGSQNFDWRSLEHIMELGLRIRDLSLLQAYEDVFEMDWALAAGEERSARATSAPGGYGFPRHVELPTGSVQATPVFSPKGWLPDESLFDLDHLKLLLDGAQESIHVQLLSYQATTHGGGYWDELESALRRAAARGVQVQLLLSNWDQRKGRIEGLQSLEALPNISIKLLTVPAWSGGFIPYARVIHAKYAVIDGVRAWIGTSNWSRGYFYESRNVGMILEGAALGQPLERFFNRGFTCAYAEEVDPCRRYPAPRIGE